MRARATLFASLVVGSLHSAVKKKKTDTGGLALFLPNFVSCLRSFASKFMNTKGLFWHFLASIPTAGTDYRENPHHMKILTLVLGGTGSITVGWTWVKLVSARHYSVQLEQMRDTGGSIAIDTAG